MPRTWPLVGRDEELRVAAAALGSRTGRSGGVVLSGPAGVGKTRLARELVARRSDAGTTAHWALATQSSRDVPLAAFGALVAGVDSSSPSALADAVEAVAARARDRRLVVGVDDAHLLDPLSALLVHRLVTDRLATVVITVREGETTSDAITSLWKDEHVPGSRSDRWTPTPRCGCWSRCWTARSTRTPPAASRR